MDDLLLFTPSNKAHMAKLEDLLKALLKNGLKISLKKCQLFKTELPFMGNTIYIEDRRVCVKPLRSRLEALQKLQLPTTPKGCRSLAGMVNFLSMIYPELQKLLKPIYNLMRKGRQFIWGKEQQKAFEEIKCLLYYICPTVWVDFIFIWIRASLLQEALSIKYKMENQN